MLCYITSQLSIYWDHIITEVVYRATSLRIHNIKLPNMKENQTNTIYYLNYLFSNNELKKLLEGKSKYM